MKKATTIFVIIGMLATIALNIFEMMRYAQTEIAGFAAFLVALIIIACLIVGICTLVSLYSDDRKVALGVLTIIFVSPIAGILYLCWQPYANYNGYKTTKPEPLSTFSSSKPTYYKEETKEDESSSADELRKWSKLKEDGIITEEEFEEKKKQLLK